MLLGFLLAAPMAGHMHVFARLTCLKGAQDIQEPTTLITVDGYFWLRGRHVTSSEVR